MKSKKIFVLLAALALSLAACGPKQSSSQQGGSSQPGSETSEGAGSSEQGGGEVAVTSVALDQQTLALEVGKSANLKATVLPENASNNKVTWEIDDATIASVSQLGKVTALKVGNAKITAKSQSNPEIKAECQLTVSEEGGKYGSANKPKTVAQILAIAAEECKNANDKTSDVVYVKGIVSKAPTNKGTFSQNIYLKDALTDAKDLLVYSANHDALKEPYQNDEVVLHGYLMNYNGTIEISNVTIDNNKVYPEVDSVTRGTSTISYEISHGSVNAEAPQSGKNLSEFSFTVTPDANYKVDLVTINGTEIAAETNGSYKGTVKGNMAVKVTITEVGVENLRAVMKYTAPEGATQSTNMTGGNDAALVNLDPTLFTVVSGNETGLYAGLNVAGNIRLYNNRNSETDKTDGTHITVSSVKANIKSIEITLASTSIADAVLQVKAGNDVVEGTNLAYTINAGSFTLKNVTDGPDSKQIHITQVAITYEMKQEVHATGISVAPATLELEEGKTGQLTATVAPANATDVPTWSSNAAGVATVDQTGRVTAVAAGNAVITAQISETIKASATVTVTAAAVINYGTAEQPLSITQAKAIMDGNMSKQPIFVKGVVSTNDAFHATYNNAKIWLQSEDGTVAQDFELYSCEIDSSIANADSYKTADALKGCEVVATGYGMKYGSTYELTNNTVDGARVNPKIISLTPPAATNPTAITLNKTSANLEAGDQVQLTATLEPAGAVGTVVWSSDPESVATVDQTGLVTAVAAGNATITAAVGDVNATCAITVTAVDPSAPKMVMVDSIAAGDIVYLACAAVSKQYAGPSNANANAIGTAAEYTSKPSQDGLSLEVAAGSTSGTFAFKLTSGDYADKYLAWSSGNSLKVAASVDANSSWKVSFDSNKNATIKNAADETRVIWWNVSSPRFCCYVDKTDGDSFKYVQLWSLEGGATPVENEVMPWYTEGTGNQAIHIEGAGIWTWVKYGDMGYENYNAFNAEKDNFEVSYESEPATTARIDAVSDDIAAEKICRVYVALGAAYNTGVLTLTVPGADGKTYEGTLEFAAGELTKINGEAVEVAVAQPVGAFRGLAKTTAGAFLPVDMILAADSVTLYINGEAATVSSYAWDGVNSSISVVTDGAYGTITASFENNVFQITGLTGAAAAALDLTYAVKLSGSCQFLDCEQDTATLQSIFLRRKMESSWVAANADDKIFSSENGKVGKGLALKCWADGKIAVTLKNDLSIPAGSIKALGCWIYNPSSTDYSTTLYFYKGAGNTNNQQAKVFTLPAGQWTFCQCGVSGLLADTDTFYNFQFYTQNVNTTLVFDNFCIYM